MRITRTFGRSAMTFVRGNAPGLCGELLRRADAHLFAALEQDDTTEQFLRAYQAALGGAGALLVTVELPGGRRGDRSAWVRLAKVPGFELWAQYFHTISKARVLTQAGVRPAPEEELLQEFLRKASEFLCDVEDFLRAGSDNAASGTARRRKSA